MVPVLLGCCRGIIRSLLRSTVNDMKHAGSGSGTDIWQPKQW